MDQEYIESNLLIGNPIYIENFGSYHSPTLSEVFYIGEKKYNELISILLLDKNNIKELQDSELSNEQILLGISIADSTFFQKVSFIFQLLFKEPIQTSEHGFFYFGDIEENRILTKEALESIKQIVRLENNLKDEKKEPEYNPANSKAKEMIDRLMKNKKNKPKTKDKINFRSIISGTCWKSKSLTILDAKNLTMYQLWDGYLRLNSIDHYENTMHGIYAGTINPKEINLPDINWANVIDKFKI